MRQHTRRIPHAILALTLLAGLVCMFPQQILQAIVVSGNVFLQGNYVEVGIHNSGSFGTTPSAPSGFHPRPEFNQFAGRLGFVVDMQKDGWTNGAPPQSGDYFVPGTPEEGWMVEWNTPTERRFGNFGLMGWHQIPTTSLVETSSGDTRSAVWEGTASAAGGAEKLKITKTIHFNTNDQFFVISTVMTNIGTTTLTSVEFMRNVDPDQEEPITGNYTTRNWVSNSGDRRLVIARGLNHGITLGLGTFDSRAVVSTEGFSNRDPDQIYDSPVTPSAASAIVADQAIALVYRFGNLAPGQSVSFDYAYILNEGDLESALSDLGAVTIVQPSGTVSGSTVLFQATTDDVPNTQKIDFYINGTLVGTDFTPDAGGIFETTFDSRQYPNGTINLKVVATFAAGQTREKTSTASVDNSGPPIAFITPQAGDIFPPGTTIPIDIQILDPAHPPVRVSFFRESASGGSLFLGQDTAAPFSASFNVNGLPEGETVTIKAVGSDSLNRSTTIQVAGTVLSNQSPTADAGGPYSFDEGGSVAVSAAGSSDPDPGDVLTYAWDLDNDGQFDDATGVTASVSASDDAVMTVAVKVTDEAGASATDSASVTVNNVAPKVTAPANAAIDEGGTFAAAGSFTDPGADTWTAVVDYGDGSGPEALALTGMAFTLNHVYAQDGLFPITVTVIDDDGGQGSGATNVAARNVPPTIMFVQLTDSTLDENGNAEIFGALTDPGVLDPHTVTINWGDGAPSVITLPAGQTAFTAVHQYLDDNPTGTPADPYGVVAMATDDDETSVPASTTVTVSNLAPVVAPITAPLAPHMVGSAMSISAGYTDAGTQDAFTCTVDWGDMTTSAGTAAGGTCAADHAYTAAGIYALTMTVTDDDTGVGQSIFKYVIVVDPSAGFVTGGGWFNSAAGSYQPDPSQAGRANFGFNARWRDGVAQGQTEFQFHRDGRMNFHSSSYEWLVVTDTRALYVGSGTINGEGDYGFLVSLVDGRPAGDGVDRLRMKIWNKATGAVVYDNNPAAGDDYAVTTAPIDNGNMVIHR